MAHMFKLFQETRSIMWLRKHKDMIDFSPAYQRRGNLWKKEQRQLLIDSILNGFDLPKFYFQFMPPESAERFYNYAIIDGKQRAEAILGFLEDDFPLSPGFIFFDDATDNAHDIAGKYYSEIEICAPAIAAHFLQYEINIVFMDTNDPDIINEMFVRLNSGVAVNTAEKRNATGGKLAQKVQEYCRTSRFFTSKIKIKNSRFQHEDLMYKFLMLTMGELDLTKNSVSQFVSKHKDFLPECSEALTITDSALQKFDLVFQENDTLLSKKNIIITLFAIHKQIASEHIRPFLKEFEDQRVSAASASKSSAKYDTVMMEFTNLLQQGADKRNSIQRRSQIMLDYYDQYLHRPQH